MLRIEIYKDQGGNEPFKDWLESLSVKFQAKVSIYIRRVARGGSRKNIKSVGAGVFEIKLTIGPGLRVYFAEIEGKIILLLCGGDKKAQKRDIKKAKEYWRDYVSK